jgi:hypothetical protein
MSKKKKHSYDLDLIKKLCKKQPKGEFNCTDVAKKYAKKKGLDFSQTVARRIQEKVVKYGLHPSKKDPKKHIQFTNACNRSFIQTKKNTIIVWAQAVTPIHERLWEYIQLYAKHQDANIIVIPGTYLNNNSPFMWKREYAWDDRLSEYLYATECKVHSHLSVIADTDIVPTAKRPLRNLQGVTGIESSIVGHPRQQMLISPTMKNRRRKFMFSTGSITVPNYRRARVGKEAQQYHRMGFLFVENINEENFVARHVYAEDDGSFQDLIWRVDENGVNIRNDWEAMIFGDTHLTKEDEEMLKESRRLFDIAKCKRSIWHDLFDGESINHHEAKNYVIQVIKARKGLHSLKNELDYNKKFVREWLDTNMYIIPSNHPDWIDKWVEYNQGAKDAHNAFLFNRFQSILFEEQAPKGLYAYVLEEEFGDKITCMHRDDSLEICGIEVNNHGDLGANGAKGTPETFAKLPHPVVSGDKHNCYTLDDAYGVGISSVLDHKYNKGMSSWAQSNGIILSNGRFQHLLYFDGKFTNLI